MIDTKKEATRSSTEEDIITSDQWDMTYLCYKNIYPKNTIRENGQVKFIYNNDISTNQALNEMLGDNPFKSFLTAHKFIKSRIQTTR